jgi:ArsR family transcriptional regulator, arsenate/arsenite/antimonite-responsive transcriptional repressor
MTYEETSIEQRVRPRFKAFPSLVSDLTWVLTFATKSHRELPGNPLREQAFAGREELAERVRSFWGDPVLCFTELQALAHHGGAICETDPDALWSAIETAVATVPLDLGLESEDDVDRDCFLVRLRRLREDPALLQTYLDLMREVWEPLNELWQASLPLLKESAAHTLSQLEGGRPFTEVAHVHCDSFQRRIPTIAALLDGGDHSFMVAPCLYFGRSLYLEFPHLTLVGTGVEDHGAMARARTEVLARRLKTVADPTRLALLHFLATRPSSVSDLATSFGLAQPTVSMHIKLLREAGLVRAERIAGRLQLKVDADAVDVMLHELRSAVADATTTHQFEMV